MSQIVESLPWNRRMGNLNFDNIVKFSKKGVVRNFPRIIKPPNHVCRHCLHGKQTRTRFTVEEHKTPQPLEIIHTDLFVPTSAKICQGDYYFMF